MLVVGKLDKPTYCAVCKFNSLRNRIIHKIFHEPYDTPRPAMSKSEYDRAFTFGVRLSWKLEGILARLATRGKVGGRTAVRRNRSA